MADDTQWRVRLAVVETMPVYARHLGMDLFNTRLKDFQARALADSVAHIRERAILNLSELSKEFGDEWMKDAILPSVQEAAKGTGPASYLGRITSLQAVSALATTMPGGVLSEVLVPQVCVPLARDRVVNVRIAAAEALIKCADKLQGENPAFVKDCIRPVSPPRLISSVLSRPRHVHALVMFLVCACDAFCKCFLSVARMLWMMGFCLLQSTCSGVMCGHEVPYADGFFCACQSTDPGGFGSRCRC